MRKKPNRSLQKKHAARIAAAQAMYAHALSATKSTTSASLAGNLIAHWRDSLQSGEAEWALGVEPEAALLEKILEAALFYADAIEEQIDGLILPGWRKERISTVALSTLRAFAGELLARPDTPPAVLIGEYTDVAASFVGEAELSFIHSALNHIANGLRTA